MASPETTGSKDITQEELDEYELLQARKLELKSKHADYLASHPEVQTMISDLTAALLEEKPDDVLDFAINFFIKAKEEKKN
mmetsp:Transcript_6745/g.8618  ORF Transcript_6745/g.8618 Transcript_6745/m.8618 type:complete len:81 (+) Transcript_6745:14-256(+)|eukprot:CAMPEP_0197320808 /NCGR_PEP_ID=MMETSP0891-20130614/61793_1 /TAXON_ID=44058 ORGANISM="Aureoumbra lagunensis, Strain CCMP1510" /NCGR_SAMPLE_ID=MMETSP0891 /ASSEMBLY_ACC=CAM_ASM_000534 /LENGTH=80 /DNA_ID=CAMNT_0042812361 /DNA_START=8 /DNA_END=250 /DNA_ORIENTATION=-